MNFNFNQALADKARRQDEELAIKRYEADTGRISAMDNGVSPSNNSGGNKQQVPANNIGNIASIAAQNAQAIQLKKPLNPSRGVYGDIGILSGPSFNDILDDKPRLKEGGFIEKIGAKLGVRKQEKPAEDPRVNAHRAANQLGGMSGDAARTLRSRQSQIEEEMKRQGYRKGITKVKDKTGKGSPRKDTVDAKLAEGEAVLNAGAAKILGRKSIAELNAKGLQAMGMQGAKPEFKDGKVHAVAGYSVEDEKNVLRSIGLDPVGAGGGQVVRALSSLPGAIKSAVRQPIANTAQAIPAKVVQQPIAQPPKRSISSMASSPIVASTPISASTPQQIDRTAQANQLDAMSRKYLYSPIEKRTTDMSNADFAARGMGDIAKIVGKDGKTTYTNIGNQNKYNNEEAQARTSAYKAGEQARTTSIAEQMATPQDVDKQASQLALSQGRKIADLQSQYMAEQDQVKRATMAENIGIMTGKERKPTARRDIVQTSRKTKGFDTEETIPMLYDPETRQWIEPPAQQAGAVQSAPLEVGTKRVINGQQAQWDGKGWKAIK